MHEWSLLIFTLALEIAAGGFAALALFRLFGNRAGGSRAGAVFAAVACGGTLFSVLHLGDMPGAYRALYHVGASWLSREVWLAGGFTLLALLCAARGRAKAVPTPLFVAAALVGLLAVYASSAVYATSAVEKWTAHTCVFAEFFASALLLGPLAAAWLLPAEEAPGSGRIAAVMLCLGALLLIVNVGGFGAAWQGGLAAARFLLFGLGLPLGLRALHGRPVLYAPALICLLLGEILGRYLFFLPA